MKLSNVKVYDLEESIIGSGYPMMTNTDEFNYDVENLKYWLNFDLDKINKIVKDNNLTVKENTVYLIIDEQEVMISGEDLIKVFSKKWHYNKTRGYIRDSKGEIELHRFIMDNPENMCVDHINRNKLDNRRENLRICTHRENSLNKDKLKNNTSGYTGVYFSKEKNKWYSTIECNKKKIQLGYTKDKEEAIKRRLEAEREMFGEFAPQRHLFEQYGIEPIQIENKRNVNLERALRHYRRVNSLSSSGLASGHNQYETGIRVAFDLTFTNKAWVELERYRFVEFVSSQSTMHRIARFDLKSQYNEYVDERIIAIMEELKDKYNESQDKEDYLRLLYSNPAGFELTARLTTNYRALKTVYAQRKNHRLPEWREFCKEIEKLPLFKEIVLGE